jgi:uncharacterized protein (DUF1800 family)
MSSTSIAAERDQVAWVLRRAGFGPTPGQLDAGLPATVDALVDPDGHGVPVAPDPWVGVDLASYDPAAKGGTNKKLIAATIGAWLVAIATTPRPFEEWMRWFWHGHFVSSIRVVKHPALMVQQLRMFGELGLGDLRTLLKAVTVDPAMLIYLDGVTNRRDGVNENYGREVLELFSLGVGHFTEEDVRAGAEALTGWRVQGFEPRRHDDSPKTYLGRTGVHDADTVVDAIVNHPACAPFITAKLARAVLGPDVDPALIERLAGEFAASGLQIRPLMRSILEAGDASGSLVLAPVPWLISMIKASGAPVTTAISQTGQSGLIPAGQLPFDAPNVAGWPGGRAWLSASTTVARFNMASTVAGLAPADGPARRAAANGDLDALADALGHPGSFGDGTRAAVADLAPHDPTGTGRLAVAMASADVALA